MDSDRKLVVNDDEEVSDHIKNQEVPYEGSKVLAIYYLALDIFKVDT